MIQKMPTATFTCFHAVVVPVAIVAPSADMLAQSQPGDWNTAFIATLMWTSVGGFAFRSAQSGPRHVIILISLIVLLSALLALCGRRFAGPWRATYSASAVPARRLDAFVGVMQTTFQKPTPLQVPAPTQTKPPSLVVRTGGFRFVPAVGYPSVQNARGS